MKKGNISKRSRRKSKEEDLEGFALTCIAIGIVTLSFIAFRTTPNHKTIVRTVKYIADKMPDL